MRPQRRRCGCHDAPCDPEISAILRPNRPAAAVEMALYKSAGERDASSSRIAWDFLHDRWKMDVRRAIPSIPYMSLAHRFGEGISLRPPNSTLTPIEAPT